MPLFFTLVFFIKPVETIGIKEVVSTIEEWNENYFQAPFFLSRVKQDICIVDTTSRIWVLSSDGKPRKVFGARGQGPGEFSKPWGVYTMEPNIYIVNNHYQNIDTFNIDGSFVERKKSKAGRLHLQFGQQSLISQIEHPSLVVWQVGSNQKEDIVLNFTDPEDELRSYFADIMDETLFLCSRSSLINRIYYCAIDSSKKQIVDLDSFQPHQKSRKEDFPKSIPKGMKFSASTLTSLTKSDQLGFLMVETAVKRDKKYCYVWCYQPKTAILSSFRFDYTALGSYPYALLHINDDRWVAGVNGAAIFFDMPIPASRK